MPLSSPPAPLLYYLYGSCTMDDYKPGWSDIDILVLTRTQISDEQARQLVSLRQSLLEEEPDDPYYRGFEGGMLMLDAFVNHTADRVVYRGTSGQRLTDISRGLYTLRTGKIIAKTAAGEWALREN